MSPIFRDGDEIGTRYSILNYLDAGGMQEVYVAFDKTLERNVALKTPKNQHAEKRFKRSAVLSAKVNHPNVARILDYFEIADRSFLIEELIQGKSLHQALSSEFHHFDSHLLAQFGHHICKGIAASHHAGVIHRDLKPGNIMIEFVNGYYCFRITDFGIAKLAESEFEEAHKSESSITGSQTMMGAIPYMAPEMVEGPKYAKTGSDVWSVGAILYKLLSGEHPFGVGLGAIPKIHKAQLPPKPTDFQTLPQFSSLNDKIWDVISQCLRKDAKSRPSADDLAKIFSDLCYSMSPRYEGAVESFRSGSGDWGFINERASSVFFHRSSFYGKRSDILTGKRVLYAKYLGEPNARAHPVLPLKDAINLIRDVPS